MNRWLVVLAGGTGSRFWPLSTPERPKQLLPLINDEPLLANTLSRLAPLGPTDRTLILTSASLVTQVSDAASSIPPENIIAEPAPAGTAAALSWAAREIERRSGAEATMMSVHADSAIGDENAFRDVLLAAERVAITEQALVTVGIVPTRPDPGFGYIQPGADAGNGAREVIRFVEKPDRTRAEWMLHEGYLWNSGIFVWRVGDFLDEVRDLTPEVSRALAGAGTGEGSAKRFFADVEHISVDVGVLERSRRVRVLPGDFGWDDVGTWGALRRARPADAAGNVTSGRVHARDASGNVVHAEEKSVVLFGVSDLVVVSTGVVTLVTTIDRSSNLKQLVESLPADLRDRA